MKISYFFLFFCFNISCFAQNILNYKDVNLNKNALQSYNKGRELLNKEKPTEALKYFHKAIEAEPRFIDAQLLVADTYYELKQYTRARAELEKVLMMDSTYMPRMFFSLGKYCEKAKMYNDAAIYFEKFATKEKSELAERSKLLAEHNRFRHIGYQNKVDFAPKNMGDSINTSLPEYFPSISADGQTLIFTVKESGFEDFYVSKKGAKNEKGESVWQNNFNLGPPVNTEGYNEGAQTISANGRLLIYTGCNRPDGLGSCDLFFAEFKNGKWTKPQNIGAPINTPAWESQPSLSADGKTLMFASSNKDGKKGGKNLFFCTRQSDGTWSIPSPVTELNTAFDDESPFLHPDGETLYFSSSGFPGFGENDIFISRKQKNGTWGKPENLGYPINTEKQEVGLVIAPDGKTAIYAAEFEDTHGALDLYTFELPQLSRSKPVTYVKGIVKDESTNRALRNVVASLALVENNKEVATVRTDERGEFLICLPVGKAYSLAVTERNYTFYSDNFELTDSNAVGKPYLLNIKLQPIKVVANGTELPKDPKNPVTNKPNTLEKNKAIVLKNVFFATGSAELKPESQAELNRLRDMLVENPTARIQINGHTDNKGADAANQTLSENRANSVREYLIQQKIDSSRLESKGFGESQPIDTNDTETGRKNNRRTEFVVL
jgi:outer membrane protein OmpA-like peptidoglycan-associated protein